MANTILKMIYKKGGQPATEIKITLENSKKDFEPSSQ